MFMGLIVAQKRSFSATPEPAWNENIRVTRFDRLFAATFGRLIPPSATPNHLTVFRMFLVPFVVLTLATDNYSLAMPLFFFAALTDWFDGALARTRRQVTEWGIIYDPVADKLLIGATLFVIVLQHMNYMLGLLLLVVEAFIIVIGWIRVRQGLVEQANLWGKIKMFTEVVGITILLLALWLGVDLLVDVSTGTLGLAVVFAVVSILTRIK